MTLPAFLVEGILRLSHRHSIPRAAHPPEAAFTRHHHDSVFYHLGHKQDAGLVHAMDRRQQPEREQRPLAHLMRRFLPGVGQVNVVDAVADERVTVPVPRIGQVVPLEVTRRCGENVPACVFLLSRTAAALYDRDMVLLVLWRCETPAVAARSIAPYAWMVCGCFSFAWMSEFAHQLQGSCDWRIVALARGALAFLFALGLAYASGAQLAFRKPGVLWVRSCAGSLSLLCTFFALAQLRTSEVLTLTNTFPIWVAVLSWPLLRIRPGWAVWLAAACGVVGVIVMQQPHFENSVGARIAVPLGLMAALSSAVAMLGLHRLKDIHPWAIVAHFSGVATLFVLASWLVGEFPDLTPLNSPWTLAILLGVGATATFGQLCLTRAFTLGQPAKVSVVGLTQIVFAMSLDVLFGGPEFSLETLAGIVLVLAPTAWIMVGKAIE